MDVKEATATNLGQMAVPEMPAVGTVLRRLEGQRVSIALADGSRIDDCALLSAGRGGDDRLWLYSNGADTFVAHAEVTDIWEVAGPR